jgi:hypothetical protein
MGIPDKPLELQQVDLDKMTLAENRVLFGAKYSIDEFYQWLLVHTNWTEEEAGQITRAELAEVHLKVAQAVSEQATPLAKSPPSENGPA